MAKSLDDDSDGLFKNLLLPIESVIKQNSTGKQHDLDKELDSYLAHLRSSSDDSSAVFVDAAVMIPNVTFLYQKNVDQIVDAMTNLVQKFKSYRTNTYSAVDDSIKKVKDTKKKVEKKRKKIYTSFEPIEIKICSTLNNFDYKSVNLSTLPPLKNIVRNTNIKTSNKNNTGLPCIYNENGESIGKKYDFMMNRPLNRELTVCEEFDWSTHVNHRPTNLDIPPMDLMDPDVYNNIDSDQSPATSDQIIYTDEVCGVNAMASMPADRVNVQQIREIKVDQSTVSDLNVKHSIHSNKPNNTKKTIKIKKSITTDKQTNNEDFNDNDNLYQITDAEHQSEIVDNFQMNQEKDADMRKYEQCQMKIFDEELAMMKRVDDWHNKLQIFLKEEENIPKFDIHKYGTDILNSFTCIGEEKSFTELVQEKNKSEVSRWFLTVLTMANTNNLKITKSDGDFYVKLLKRERHSEELQSCISNQIVSKQN